MNGKNKLLEYLAERTGNDCLSNLREYADAPHLDRIFDNIPLDMFSLDQWHAAAEYLTEKKLERTQAFELRELLIGWAASRPFPWNKLGK